MPKSPNSGGYDDGYTSCDCFWGRAPGSLIQRFLSRESRRPGLRVLDLGCGEGKNALALAKSGALVTAVDCSPVALANAKLHCQHQNLAWVNADCRDFLKVGKRYDLIIMYGLLHCLPSLDEIASVVRRALDLTSDGGTHVVATFNDGPHDLSAHPNLRPTLAPHAFYLSLYAQHDAVYTSNEMLYETHPHNNIPHHHSLTRLIVEKRP